MAHELSHLTNLASSASGSPLAQAAVAVGTQGLAGLGNYFGQKATAKANRELSDYQYSKDLNMWALENTYNSPAQQMKRLSAAGLNPNLIYGSGGATTQSAPAPKYEKSEADYRLPKMDVLGAYQQMRMQDETIKQMDAQKELIQAQTFKSLSDAFTGGYNRAQLSASTSKTLFDTQQAQNLAPYQVQHAELTNEKLVEEIILTAKKSNLNDAQIAVLKQTLNNLKKTGENITKDGILKDLVAQEKQLELNYQKQGIDKGLPTVLRPVMPAIRGVREYVEDLFDGKKLNIDPLIK